MKGSKKNVVLLSNNINKCGVEDYNGIAKKRVEEEGVQ